jgi:predicted transcriptional regulator
MDEFALKHEHTYFRKAVHRNNRKFVVTSEMLTVLTLIDEIKSLEQLESESRMPPHKVREVISVLMEAGLVAPARQNENGRYLDSKNFMEPLREHLLNAVGPVADFILNDVFVDMNIRPDRVPVSQAADVIINLSKEIVDDEMKAEFQKAMIGRIQRKNG